ncbi:MAG: sigma-70 family RNA polymerase sigma factor [bacterium]|nr:sigma-70 family RNA polymerase sigma factor [bacterium]
MDEDGSKEASPIARAPARETDGHASPAGADFVLVRSAREGDPIAVEELMGRLRCVRAALFARNAQLGAPLGSDELEDVTQDTLIAIWGKLDRFEGFGRIETWAYRFSVLELRTRLVAKRRAPVFVEGLEREADAQREVPGEEELERAYAALVHLGSPEERVIRLKLFEDLTFEEIADRLGQSVNTLKAQYYRGLRKLRSALPSEDEADPSRSQA